MHRALAACVTASVLSLSYYAPNNDWHSPLKRQWRALEHYSSGQENTRDKEGAKGPGYCFVCAVTRVSVFKGLVT